MPLISRAPSLPTHFSASPTPSSFVSGLTHSLFLLGSTHSLLLLSHLSFSASHFSSHPLPPLSRSHPFPPPPTHSLILLGLTLPPTPSSSPPPSSFSLSPFFSSSNQNAWSQIPTSPPTQSHLLPFPKSLHLLPCMLISPHLAFSKSLHLLTLSRDNRNLGMKPGPRSLGTKSQDRGAGTDLGLCPCNALDYLVYLMVDIF